MVIHLVGPLRMRIFSTTYDSTLSRKGVPLFTQGRAALLPTGQPRINLWPLYFDWFQPKKSEMKEWTAWLNYDTMSWFARIVPIEEGEGSHVCLWANVYTTISESTVALIPSRYFGSRGYRVAIFPMWAIRYQPCQEKGITFWRLRTFAPLSWVWRPWRENLHDSPSRVVNCNSFWSLDLVEKGFAYEVRKCLLPRGKMSTMLSYYKTLEDLGWVLQGHVPMKSSQGKSCRLAFEAAKPAGAQDSHGDLMRPGWHIECSVMSTEILGRDTIETSTVVELIWVSHHTNEVRPVKKQKQARLLTLDA